MGVFSEFNPRSYLGEYYSGVGLENDGLLRFFAEAYKGIDEESLILEFGGGPTIYQLITAARKAREIHFSDFLSANIKEVALWGEGIEGAFDWTAFIQRALEHEGLSTVTGNDIAAREALIRSKLTRYLPCDAFKKDPLGPDFREGYDLVSVNFVPESIVTSKEDWSQLMQNICSLVRRRGSLIMTAIKEAEYYLIGDKKFPAVSVNESDLIETLQNLHFRNFLLKSIPAETMDRTKGYKGYNGMIFIRALR